MKNIKMKKISIIFSLGIVVFLSVLLINLLNTHSIKANDVKNELDTNVNGTTTQKENIYTQEYLDKYFEGFNGNDMVLQLPGGGFAFSFEYTPGEADAIIIDSNGKRAEYDIETDPNAETVDEAKIRLLNQVME